MSAGFPSPDLSLQVAASALGGGLIVEGAVLGGAVVGADCAASSPSAQPASSTAASAASSTNKRHEPHLCTLRASLDISRRAPTSTHVARPWSLAGCRPRTGCSCGLSHLSVHIVTR